MGWQGELNLSKSDESLLLDQRLFDRLVTVATKLLKRHNWGNGAVPHGIEPKDLALDAIEDVFFKPSTWDRTAYPLPYPVLAGMVESKVANLVRSGRNRFVRELPPGDEGPAEPDEYNDSNLSEAPERVDRIEAAVEHDADMLRYVKAAQKSHIREDIAIELGMTPTQVTNLSKRVKRILRGRETEFGIKINQDQENP